MELLNQIFTWLVGYGDVVTAALTFTVAKRYATLKGGIRSGVVDITFDTGGPTWTVLNTDLKLNGIFNLYFPAHIDGFVLAALRVSDTEWTIDAREEADGGTALQGIDASDLSTKVVRVKYEGY